MVKWLLVLVFICGGCLLSEIMFPTTKDEVPLPGGGKMVRIKEGDVSIDTRFYSASGVLLKHSWTDYSGVSHSDDYDETGELIRSE